MFLTEHRLRRELAMKEAEYVQCPNCLRSFQKVIVLEVETECKCPSCDYKFAVTLTDKVKEEAA